jgi:hypothetical protein
MKTTQIILIGSPLLGNEAAFLRMLCTDLAGLDVTIIANFVVGSRQIDFLVVTPTNAVLIELKNYHHPVFGEMNGAWTVRDAAGNVVPEPRFNLWQQTLEESFALSDAMKHDARRQQTAPLSKGGYYKFYRTFLCFYPEIYPGSKVTRGDHRVRVRGYADVLDAIKTEVVSGWSIPEWEAFAKRSLGVSAVTLEAAVNPRVLAGHAHLAGYRARMETTLGAGLAPMLESEGGARSGLDVIGALQGQQHNLLHGPSGSTKTFHLHHLALTLAAGTREMPFLVEAKRYRGGDFGPWLRQSIAPFFASDPTILLAALEDTGRAPVLLIDALNECASGLRDDLLHGALAFALRYDARIVLTTQDSTTPLAGLQAEPIALELPRNAQKRRIYAYHAGIEPTADLDILCAGFETAYDLAIAGRCHAAGSPPGSRAELYDRYVAMSLPKTNAFTAAALLRHIAGNMHETLSIALTRRTYEEVAERFLTENDANIALLDAVSETRLIDLTADSFSFEHELLLTYLEAEYLLRKTPDIDTLAEELAKPRNAYLIEFILPRIAAPTERARLIAVVKDPTLLERIFFGECGTDARATLREAIAAYIAAAVVDVPNWTVDFTTVALEDGEERLASVEVLGARQWTPAEKRLAPLLGYALSDPELRDAALRLFDVTEAKLRNEICATAPAAGFSFRYAWSETIRFHGGQLGHSNMLPCTEMLLAAKQRSWSRRPAPSLEFLRAALLERASAVPPSDFAINLILEDHEFIGAAERIAANLGLIEAAWHGGIGAHRLSVLHAFRNMRRALIEGDPAQMTRAMAILDGFTSINIMLDSLIFETKSLFEAFPPPVSVEDALAEMRLCIAPNAASDPSLALIADYHKTSAADVLAGRAYSLLGNSFEDVFQGAYYEAYKSTTMNASLCSPSPWRNRRWVSTPDGFCTNSSSATPRRRCRFSKRTSVRSISPAVSCRTRSPRR